MGVWGYCKSESVHAVRGSFSGETLPLNLFLLQFGCLLVNPSTHQNSDRELLLGPERSEGGGREREREGRERGRGWERGWDGRRWEGMGEDGSLAQKRGMN